MKLRTAALLTSLLVLGTACSKPAEVPPEQPPPPVQATPRTSEAPAPVSACLAPEKTEGTVAFAVGGTPSLPGEQVAVTRGLCTANTYTAPVGISFRLPPGITETDLRAGLSVEGAAYTLHYAAFHDHTWARVELAAGKPGDQVKVLLTGPAELGFHLSRHAAPTVAVELRDGSGRWVPLPAGSTLPKGPLDLRFRLTGEPSVAELRRRIADAVKNPFEIKQVAPDLVEVHVPEPYPQLFFNFYGLSSESGLLVQEMGAVVYTGKAPHLVSLDVATGEERPLTEAPADIQVAKLSPDGTVAAVLAMDPTSYTQHPYVMDAVRGTSTRVGAGDGGWPFGMMAHFRENQVLFPAWFKLVTFDLRTGTAREMKSAGRQWGEASPDGRYIFGFTPDYDAANQDRLAPVDIVLYDTVTGTERVIKQAVRFVMPYHDPAGLGHRWTPEGVLLLPDVLEAKDRIPTRERTVAIDPATGKVTPSGEGAVEYAGLPQWVTGPSNWAYNPQHSWTWDDVSVRTPDGYTKVWGKGWVLGWTPEGRLLVVRWENAQYRREPPGH